ncbi:MAG: efflux RND transporter periplasmic adaptor subunit [Verrucomicrobiales bacterium]|nr:efflux RND transporter periplasmic adaptor subunit [Verrucomicrobiales bacterium]
MKTFFRLLLPLLVLGLAISGYRYLVASKPEPRQHTMPPVVTQVKATRLQPQSYQVQLESRGTVRPRTTTTLIPEVAGTIIEMSPAFREGGFFEKGDLLLKIDPLNYQTAITISQAALAQAKAALEEEKARAVQAVENWKRLGKTGKPSELVLRIPQLAEAEARLASSKASIIRAQRDLERTIIRAPYAGRILSKEVDIGQYVSPGTSLGRCYAVDYVEIRLPLTNRQLAFIDLPESYRHQNPAEKNKAKSKVTLTGSIGAQNAQWTGEIVRVEGAIDQLSRQLFVVAQVDDPYKKDQQHRPPLKIGLFVHATIQAKKLENVFVLPRQAVRAGNEVIIIDQKNRIRRQTTSPIWSDKKSIIIPAGEQGGLKPGEIICLTPLAFPANGAQVSPTIDGIPPTKKQEPHH